MPQTPDPHEFREAMEQASSIASRVQVDLMDGVFAPNKNTNPIQCWWPEDIEADIHFMYQKPLTDLTTLISLKPHMIILHAESDGNILDAITHIAKFGIKTGVALLIDTQPEAYVDLISVADHVLLFGGTLGESGQAELSVLDKIEKITQVNPTIEIGWDGGATLENVRQIADAGVEVINVGGAIRGTDDPLKSYQQLMNQLEK